MPLDLAYDLSNFTPADAVPLQSNFSRVEQYVNQETITRDGVTAMTAQLKLVGNPTAPLDAATKQYVDLLLPIGVILPFGGTVAPGAGIWAMANGADMSTSAYPELFTVYQYRFGGSAGNFKLPNVMDKMPIGASATRPLGSYGGTATSSLPDHDHAATLTLATSVSAADLNHYHTQRNHTHGASTNTVGRHDHGWGDGAQFLFHQVNGWATVQGGNGTPTALASWNPQGDHAHTVTVGGPSDPNTSWWHEIGDATIAGRAVHGHTVTGTASGTTGKKAALSPDAGTTTANSNVPPYVALNWIARVA